MLRSASLALFAAALSACATSGTAAEARERELSSLRDELRDLRADREADRRRIEALEAHLTALAGHGQKSARDVPSVGEPGASVSSAPRSLKMVKLEPRPEEEGSIFIEDVSSHGSRETKIAAGRGGPGGADTAPPLPTDIPLGSPPVNQVDYEQGVAALAAGKPGEAEKLLSRFVEKSPRHPAADNALLALGDAYVKDQKPGLALETWERIVKDYPAGDSVSQALLRYAGTCKDLGRKAAARAALERVLQDFPGSDAAAEARTGLAAFGG